jgi:hypothetical protein
VITGMAVEEPTGDPAPVTVVLVIETVEVLEPSLLVTVIPVPAVIAPPTVS